MKCSNMLCGQVLGDFPYRRGTQSFCSTQCLSMILPEISPRDDPDNQYFSRPKFEAKIVPFPTAKGAT